MKVPNSEGEGKDDEDHADVRRVEPSVVDAKKNDGNNATKRRKDKKKKSVKSKWEINFSPTSHSAHLSLLPSPLILINN